MNQIVNKAQETKDVSTLIDIFEQHASLNSEKIAFRYLDNDEQLMGEWRYQDVKRFSLAVGEQLSKCGKHGDRVILIFDQGLEFIAAFLGCLYAGRVAVPIYIPKPKRGLDWVKSVIANSEAKIILTTQKLCESLQPHFDATGEMLLQDLDWLNIESMLYGKSDAKDRESIQLNFPKIDDIAFLQYTSGSTGTPKGVIVSHGNLVANNAAHAQGISAHQDSVFISWLPHYHDMGLVGIISLCLYTGSSLVFFHPFSFIQKPIRWLRAITQWNGTISAAPNFAYDACVDKISEDERKGLDLSSLEIIWNGAEPIRYETVKRFFDIYSSYGLSKKAMIMGYGLAESTLVVSVERDPVVLSVDAQALREGEVTVYTSASVFDMDWAQQPKTAYPFMSSGLAVQNHALEIVDTEHCCSLPAFHVGEIWVSGPAVTQGYFSQYQLSQEVFKAQLKDRVDINWVHTGDIGFKDDCGRLYIVSRMKDLIIVNGRNLAPQDIEHTASHADPALAINEAAAFTVLANGIEKLAIAVEVQRVALRHMNVEDVIAKIRVAVSRQHEVSPFFIVLLSPAHLPKTSSGKVQRGLTCLSVIEKRLTEVGWWIEDGWEREQLEQPFHHLSFVGRKQGVIEKKGGAYQVDAGDAELFHHAALEAETLASFRTVKAIEIWIREWVKKRKKLPWIVVKDALALDELGLDSVDQVELITDLGMELAIEIDPVIVWEAGSIEALAGEVLQKVRETAKAR